MILPDKKVGEHWYWCQAEQPIEGKDKLVDAMRDLIRKLVGERLDKAWPASPKFETERKQALLLVLYEFGINPEDFK